MSRQSLHSLSDQQILSRIETLTRRERSITLLVLLHLNEIERRRLHLKRGHSSMFDYCTSGLGYSASAASRRIKTARCVRLYPEIQALLESNEVNISTVAQVSRVLTPVNKDQILARIRGKSQREVEAVVAEFEPLAGMPKERARTVVVRVAAPTIPLAASAEAVSRTLQAEKPDLSENLPMMATHDRNGCARQTASDAVPGEVKGAATTFQRRTLLQFSASDAFMAKLEKVRSLAWHRLPANASLEQVFELALDLMIEKNDPSRRAARRELAAARRRQDRSETKRHLKTCESTTVTDVRYIPAVTKDNVYVRDNGRCTFTRGGRRCASTKALQFDHVRPVALGGEGTEENLRLLCAYHNRLEAERLLGSRIVRERT
jgi:5-methylcytosine-specific restriction endonuclease McrA